MAFKNAPIRLRVRFGFFKLNASCCMACWITSNTCGDGFEPCSVNHLSITKPSCFHFSL
ncbi:Uncharacterised protein [Vibrio cholerae]|nr:Uncharacterised protein [Vibrio cholerae]